MRRGFTLIELSIVLVVIGLLIGGILVARSMISTVKIQGQIKQWQALDTAVNNFVTSYKYLPGDCMACGNSSVLYWASSNSNGVLENGGTAYDADAAQCQGAYSNSGGECLEFWPQMVNVKMAPYSNEYTNITFSPTGNNPSQHWAWAGNGSGYSWSMPLLSITPKGSRENSIEVNWTKQGGLFWYSGWNNGTQPFAVLQALAIDTKIDDGIVNTGDVMAASYFPPTTNDYIIPKAIGTDARCSWDGSDCCYSASTANHYNLNISTGCGLLVKANVYK